MEVVRNQFQNKYGREKLKKLKLVPQLELLKERTNYFNLKSQLDQLQPQQKKHKTQIKMFDTCKRGFTCKKKICKLWEFGIAMKKKYEVFDELDFQEITATVKVSCNEKLFSIRNIEWKKKSNGKMKKAKSKISTKRRSL